MTDNHPPLNLDPQSLAWITTMPITPDVPKPRKAERKTEKPVEDTKAEPEKVRPLPRFV